MSEGLYVSLQGPIPQFRLVTILPESDFDSKVVCTLNIVPIDDCPSFEALSYTWGDPTCTQEIILDGKPFNVTENLASALRQLRYSEKHRQMWIDAICINQTDNKERNHQVRQMSKIYKNAAQVAVWLGESFGGSKGAIKLLRALGRDSQLHWDPRSGPAPDKELLEGGNNIFYMVFLLRRSWWGRVWTVQESIIPENLIFYCGDDTFSGEELFTVSQSYFHHTISCCQDYAWELSGADVDGELNNVFSEVATLIRFRRGALKIRLHKLLARFRHRQSSDPHDKIFGFLGLAEDLEDYVIDYDRPFTETYEETALNLMMGSRTLDVLSQVFGEDNHVISHPDYVPDLSYKLASWCPNWKLPLKFWTLRQLNNRLEDIDLFNASGGKRVDGFSPPPPKSSSGDSYPSRLLVLQGKMFDYIQETSEIRWSSRAGFDKILQRWHQVMQADQRSTALYRDGKPWTEAFWHTICGGIVAQRVDQDGRRSTYLAKDAETSIFEYWWKHTVLSSKEDSPPPESAEAYPSVLIQALDTQVRVAAMNRRFFMSKGGLMGLAPAAAKEGDMICVLLGGKVPYVVRENPGAKFDYKGKRYPGLEFLGDSYVQGIMNGEALQGESEQLEPFFLV